MLDSCCKCCEKRIVDCRKDCKQWKIHQLLKIREYENRRNACLSCPSNKNKLAAYTKKIMNSKQRGGGSY